MRKYIKYFIILASSIAVLSSSVVEVKGMEVEENVQKNKRKRDDKVGEIEINKKQKLYTGTIWSQKREKGNILLWDNAFNKSLCKELNLKLNSKITREPCKGASDAIVNILKINETPIVVIKYFKDIEKGMKEYNSSDHAYEDLKPNELKMAKIRGALYPRDKRSVVLLSNLAKGKTIYKTLEDNTDKAFQKHVIQSVVQYFAKLHISSWKKETYEELIMKCGKVQKIESKTISQHIQGRLEDKIGPLRDQETFRDLGPIGANSQEKLKEVVDAALLRNKNALKNRKLRLTLIHGDAHLGNLFYHKSGKKWITFRNVTGIDYSTMGSIPGDPAEDIGRFIGSLWTWIAELPPEPEAPTQGFFGSFRSLWTWWSAEKKDLEEKCRRVMEWENMIIKEYIESWRKETSRNTTEEELKKYDELLKNNIEAYKLGYFRYYYNETLSKKPAEQKQEVASLYEESIKPKQESRTCTLF